MKKIIFAMQFLLSVMSLNAQKVTTGSFSSLANEKSVRITIDYSESTIGKIPFEAFLEVEENWEKGYRDIMQKLIKSINKYSGGLVYSAIKETNYQLVFKATKVDKDGETYGYLLLLDKGSNIIGAAENFNANGGTFGSQTNLMSDAAERLGKKIAQFIKKQTKKK